MQFRGGKFWGKGVYVNTVEKHGNENTIKAYVQSIDRKTVIAVVRLLITNSPAPGMLS